MKFLRLFFFGSLLAVCLIVGISGLLGLGWVIMNVSYMVLSSKFGFSPGHSEVASTALMCVTMTGFLFALGGCTKDGGSK